MSSKRSVLPPSLPKDIDLEPSEKLVALVQQHWFVFRDPFLLMFFVPFLLFSATFYADLLSWPAWVQNLLGQLSLYGSGVVFVVGLALFLWKFYLWRASYYLVTNKRLFAIARRGLFAEDNRQTSLSNIQDVSAQVSGIQAILYGFGDVIVQLWTDDVPMVLSKIPRPKVVQQMIMQQVLGTDATPSPSSPSAGERHTDYTSRLPD